VSDEPVEIDAEDYEEIVDRVAAIDVAKASGEVCTRVPHPSIPGRRLTRVWTVEATTNAIIDLADWLVRDRIDRVVVESTSDYWRPFFYLLEAAGLTVWLVNARDAKQVPGRPKTDKLDTVWLAKLNERGMVRPSFVPPTEIRRLRDYTRLRFDLVGDRTRQVERLEKLLEDALIKLSSVATDFMGVSGRDDHHAELARLLLDEIDALSAKVDMLTFRVEQLIADMPAAQAPASDDSPGPSAGNATKATLPVVERLDEITGIGVNTAQVLVAELGLDMSQFPTPGHLVSWAKVSPRTIQSGTRTRSGKTGKGNRYLRAALGEAAVAAAKTDTFLGERYRRLVKRRGKLKALVAVARSILIIVWELLADPTARYHDLGADFYTRRIDRNRRQRHLVRQLQALGYAVRLEALPMAA
jgi:transposase